ncbi:hypothetical protein AXF42_Ash018828 [Apostasia shenzhenica]|uniref:AIPP2-like SPOC-like domain-containing protein n=1 Tax=Apostasia shenzhenica TaxID=1088818 RepID=A0A2I0B162_9ASPA|nr:hypothetical protein AXF42_Ash018828 [Apostasia shenzhenica]
MGTVCWECGDIGLREALIYCVRCKIAPRHRYCLEKIPEDLNGIVEWQCEDCRDLYSHPKKLRSPGRKARLPMTLCCPRSAKIRSKFSNKTSPCSSRNLKFTDRKSGFHSTFSCSGKSEVEPKDRCHDYTVDEECFNLQHERPSTALRIDSSLNVDIHVNHHDLHRTTSTCSFGALGDVESSVSGVNKQNESGPIVENDGCNDRQVKDSNCSIGASVVVESSTCLPVEEHVMKDYAKDKPKRRRLVLKSEIDFNDSNPSHDDQNMDIQIVAKSSPITSFEALDLQDEHIETSSLPIEFPCKLALPVMPVDCPVWRGSFIISNEELGPFGAHLSNRACGKVCNLASNFPLFLFMEKLPRLAAWPNSFKKSPPTDDDIALFFFPGNTRAETVLDELVDDITNNDLVLRFQFDNFELLSFSSIILPHEQQRFGEKFFVWGVFKPRSAQISNLAHVYDKHPYKLEVIQENDGNYSANKKKDVLDVTQFKQFKGTEKVNSAFSIASFEEGTLRTCYMKPDVELICPEKSFPIAVCSSSSKSCLSESRDLTEEKKEMARGRLKVSRELEEGEISDDEEMKRGVCEDVCSNTSVAADALQHHLNGIDDGKLRKSRDIIVGQIRDDSEDDLELFPLVAQDMAITAKIGRAKHDINLDLGLSSSYAANVSEFGDSRSIMRLNSSIF